MNSPGAVSCSPRSAAPGVQEPAATLPVKRAPVERPQAAGQSPATAVLPVMPTAAAGDTKQPSGTAGGSYGPGGSDSTGMARREGRMGREDLAGPVSRRAGLVVEAAEETTEAQPTLYRGTLMRSRLEANWAATLDHYQIEWTYEPQLYRLPSGALYLPDFWLPAVGTFIEVKGTHMRRLEKTYELAEEVTESVIVLIGFPPLRRSTDGTLWDPYLQWRDALGYDTRLTRCPSCSGWQWLRPQLSRNCRLCDFPHVGLLAKAGEMRFVRAKPDRSVVLEG